MGTSITSGQAISLQKLASLLSRDSQLDAAEDAASRAIDLLLDQGNQFSLCQCYRDLGNIHSSKGETEKAANHFKTAIGIASTNNWPDQLFWSNLSLAGLSFGENRVDEAHAHIERAKSYVMDDAYLLGCATEKQARFWYEECKFEEAKSEASRALDLYAKLGATKYVRHCEDMLRDIEEGMNDLVATRTPDGEREFPRTVLLPSPVDSPLLARGIEGGY